MIVIPGDLVDLNTYINAERTNRYVAAGLKRSQTEIVAYYARHKKPVPSYPVRVVYRWYMRDSRKDIDNVAFAKKFINDGLVEVGVLKGDSQRFVSAFRDEFYIDKENPRIEVDFEAIA